MVSFDEFIAGLFAVPEDLHDGAGMLQIIILMVAYGYVLKLASSMISEGSELLLLIPSMAGIIGSVVLPILGAVPDGAIIMFSGLGPDAQEKLKVGVGALAGSTVMLLTVPWALAVIFGRVNLDEQGQGAYKHNPKLGSTGSWSLTKVGVNCTAAIKPTSIFMMGSSLVYIIIQGPAFGYHCATGDVCPRKSNEHWWAFAGLMACILSFFLYLWYQIHTADGEARSEKRFEVLNAAIENGKISIAGAFGELLSLLKTSEPEKAAAVRAHFHKTLRVYFDKYDRSADGHIDESELALLLRDLGENLAPAEASRYFKAIDRNSDAKLDFNEFCGAMEAFIQDRSLISSYQSPGRAPTRRQIGGAAAIRVAPAPEPIIAEPDTAVTPIDGGSGLHQRHASKQPLAAHSSEEDVEEEVELPEDLKDLPPQVQQRRIKMRAAWMMALGTVIVIVFSDPMVEVLSVFGSRIRVPSFFIAFVLAPLASNGSEILATISYAKKKTPKTISISFSTLLGAACMNNSFCLGVFLLLIFAKKLAWEFSAETIAIIAVQMVIGVMAMKTTHRLLDAIIVLAMYPLALILVIVLENVAGLN